MKTPTVTTKIARQYLQLIRAGKYAEFVHSVLMDECDKSNERMSKRSPAERAKNKKSIREMRKARNRGAGAPRKTRLFQFDPNYNRAYIAGQVSAAFITDIFIAVKNGKESYSALGTSEEELKALLWQTRKDECSAHLQHFNAKYNSSSRHAATERIQKILRNHSKELSYLAKS